MSNLPSTHHDNATDSAQGDDGVSKTQRKQASHARQDLGEAIAELGLARFAALGLPETLCSAIDELRRVRSHEGRRRQMQYIGKWMRKLDDETVAGIEKIIAAARKPSRDETLAMHRLERWRDTLIDDDAALDQWMQHYPATDVQHLRSLVRAARKEGRVEAGQRAGRAYRALYQTLKDTISAAQASQGTLQATSHDEESA